MKKVIIIGGGIAGMTAGVLLQKAGFQTEIFEKNPIVGGQCTGWKREGYFIDNCIHWLTGTREGSDLNALWKEIGALGDDVALHQKEMFFSSKLGKDTLTFWRDKERTRREMIALSPEDEQEINQLIEYVGMAETLTVPVEKPFDEMSVRDYIKLGMSMKAMGKVMKVYGKMDMKTFAMRFKHPLIQRAILDYMPPGYQAYAFLASYGTVTGENGDIPKGGSLAMAMRILNTYKKHGGTIHTNEAVKKIIIEGNQARGIELSTGKVVTADYVISACDPDYTFGTLLPISYMPKTLQKQYELRTTYPVTSSFQVAFAVDGQYDELSGTRIFDCETFQIGEEVIHAMSSQSYDYEPSFAPEGKTILQTNFIQSEASYTYWEKVYEHQEAYSRKKQELAEHIKQRLIKEYPFLEGKIHAIDSWTPMTYKRYCNAYKGAYMAFITTKEAKSITTAGILKGLENVMIASQWLMGPGGLPTAAAMGKFAAWRIIKKET